MWVITWEWEWKGEEGAGGGNVRAGRAHCALARDQLLNVYVSVSRCSKGCMCVCVLAGVERGVCVCAFSWGCAHNVCDLRLAGIKIEFTTQGNWRVKKLAKGVRYSQVN